MHLTLTARIPTAATEQPIATNTRAAMDLIIRQLVSGILHSGTRTVTVPIREQKEEVYPTPSLINE